MNYENIHLKFMQMFQVKSVQKLLKLNACLPPLDEQRQIADVLSAQDNVIALKERLIAEKSRQKRYLMQQFLTGKRRLPGRGDGPIFYHLGR